METWTYSWALRNLFAELLMPPGIWVLCILLALVLIRQRAFLQKIIIVVAACMIWICSTPIFAQWLTHVSDAWMHWPTPWGLESNSSHIENHASSAVVVLSGGRRKAAIESPEYQGHDLSAASMERLRMGVRLARATKLPILLTGGAPDKTTAEDLPEAKVMAMILEKEFELRAKWLEIKSQTTQENAEFSATLLKRDGIKTIYLVTHFWHMPRAQQIFEQYGLKVITVAHGFNESSKLNPTDFYPSSLKETRQIWHEIIGVIWYRLRY